jgi:Protein of unknown function (DUF3140)
MSAPPDEQQTLHDFRDVVNMTPAALRHWLESDDSKSVGMTPAGERVTGANQAESVGHHMGQRILELQQRPQGQLTPADYADMRKVVGYVHRHMAQRPSGDIEGSRWRKSLMNWGHDPLA